MIRRRAAAVAGTVMTLALTTALPAGAMGLGTAAPSTAPTTGAAHATTALTTGGTHARRPSVDRVPTPNLRWGKCPPAPPGKPSTAAFRCATAVVPMDYAHPRNGKTFKLAVIKAPARKPARKIGTMLWNPGGPSDAGTAYLPAAGGGFPAQVRDRFDIVSWDPRGMGGYTTPVVQCFPNEQQEANYASRYNGPSIPQTRTELAAFIRFATGLRKQCVRYAGNLLRHVSTADNARDMELLRRAVGDRKTTYYGTSYGTYLGATYLNMFPKRIRAAVLDGAIAPRTYAGNNPRQRNLTTFLRIGSDLGSAETVKEFMRQCGAVSAAQCAFTAGSPAATLQRWTTLLARLRQAPVTIDGQPLDDVSLLAVVQGSIYTQRAVPGNPRFPGWQSVGTLINTAWKATEDRPAGSPPAPTAPPVESTAPTARSVYTTSAGRQLAVICGESPNPRSLRANINQALVSYRRAGLNGWPFVGLCRGWTTKASSAYVGPWDRRTSAPVLVVGNRFDPATPYFSSRGMARTLARGRFLSVEDYGHTVLLNPNRCAQQRIARYLIHGDLPPAGTSCPRDQSPFAS